MRFASFPHSGGPCHKRWLAAAHVGIALFLLVTSLIDPRGRVLAQADEFAELGPENLSLSGSASQPAVLIRPDGTLRVFWWDRFDGVTRVEGQPGAWSDPITTPIVRVERLERPTPSGNEFAYTPISVMPTLVGDLSGTAHALWLGESDGETGAHPLWYARMGLEENAWSTPRSLAESAVSFSLTDDISNTLHLVYIRDLDTPSEPSGLYYRRSGDQGRSWSPPVMVHASRYYRLMTPEGADLSLIVAPPGRVYVTWRDPHLGQVMFTVSDEGEEGLGWRTPVAVGQPEIGSRRGRFLSMPEGSGDEIWLLWESAGYSTDCVLQQASVEELLESGDRGETVLEALNVCPEPGAEWFLPLAEDQVLWGIEEDGGSATWVVWNGEQWSEPQGLRFDFEDPLREVRVYLTDLQAVFVEMLAAEEGDASRSQSDKPLLTVVGVGETRDVWAVPLDSDTLDTVFAPPSPWSPLVPVTQSQPEPSAPSVVIDEEGRVHVLWSELESAERETTVLWYARWDNGRWSRPAPVLRSPEGGAREPAFVLSGEYLHALWSGGPYGHLWYSRAFVRDAYAAGGWSEPQALNGLKAEDPETSGSETSGSETDGSETGGSETEGSNMVRSSPYLAAAAGTLHAVYAVPVNQQRGIYYVSSKDGGETWGTPASIFDAEEAGWPMIDAPQLAVDLQGGLHVVWLRPALATGEPAQGIYYAWSRDGGQTWTDPFVAAEGAYGWPQVTVNGLNQVHLLWQDVGRTGIWWHRWLVDVSSQSGGTDAWAGWTRDQQVVGMRDVVGPVAWIPDGDGKLHLVGIRPSSESAPALIYTEWTDGNWEPREPLALDIEPGEVAAALQPQLGRLDVLIEGRALTAEATLQPELWHTSRAVSSTSTITVIVPGQPLTPTPTPTPTSEPIVTATPDLRSGPPPVATSNPLPFSMSLLLAGGLAAVIVVVAFGLRLLWIGRR